MSTSWRELLYRVLDGEELTVAEAGALAQALRQGANEATARKSCSAFIAAYTRS